MKDVIVRECGGLVGALRLSINALNGEFFTFKNANVRETLCLQYCLSDSIADRMSCCFGSAHTENDLKMFLKGCFKNKITWCKGFENQQEPELFFEIINIVPSYFHLYFHHSGYKDFGN